MVKKITESSNNLPFFYIFLIGVGILFLQVIYFRQAVFLETYDAPYWKDRFEHSQWSLPLSKRSLGDDGIYAYGGYQLMQGASIEETNTNKPPVGIYLIGLSIKFFSNPTIVMLFIGIATLITFYFFAKEILQKKSYAMLAVAFLAINPMFWRKTRYERF